MNTLKIMALGALILSVAMGCTELPELDDPRDYYLAENDCDLGGQWTVTISTDDGECFSAGSIQEPLNIGIADGELDVEFENNSEFEKAVYAGTCGLQLVRRFVLPETETSYESHRFFVVRVDFDEDTLTGTYDWSQENFLGGVRQGHCSQILSLSGTRSGTL